MSDLITRKIKSVYLKPAPWGNQGYYGHRVVFEDGSKGEIYQCKEANPDWLKEGKPLSFILRPSNFPDSPFILTMESIEQEKEHKRTEASAPTPNRFQKKSSGGWKGNARLEDDPVIWLQKQKFISILKFYEVLMPLVLKGDIKYESLQQEVSKHLEFTLKKTGMDEAPMAPVSTVASSAPVKTTKSIANTTLSAIPMPTSAVKDERETFTSNEREPEPEVSPDQYANYPEPTLFAQDTGVDTDTPITAYLQDKINKCFTKSKLLTLQKGLSPKELNNKKIMEAFFKRKNEIANKSK